MPVRVPMGPRDVEEAHRAATPLELLFDLTFVVAIAQAASSFHHALVEGHASDGLLVFPLAFFGVWWAWMNFTWFASAYDNDDVPYRLAVLVQMTGVLIMAAGIPRAFDDMDFGVATLGYVVMRLSVVIQWLRAAANHPEGRACTLRYAGGIAALQIGWVLRLQLPDGVGTATFIALAIGELAIPFWAESRSRTPWHPRHIVERYGLFIIIVLGESILAATMGVQTALDADGTFTDLAPVIVGGLLIVFSLWWIYFDLPEQRIVDTLRVRFDEQLHAPFTWGYGHYFVFGAIAATGAGLAIAVDQVTHHSLLTDLEAAFTVTTPVALYLLVVWALHHRYKDVSARHDAMVLGVIACILGASFTPEPVLLTGLLLAALVAVSVVGDWSLSTDD